MEEAIAKACRALPRRHKAFRTALKAIDNTPHIRRRAKGYPGLFRIIVEQQVSVPSAQAILARCKAAFPKITPAIILDCDEQDLRECGLSGPKIRYVKILAEAITDKSIRLQALKKMSDEEALSYLCQVKGIGPWSAAIYLLFCEGRMDIWPQKDVALLAAWAAAAGLETRPKMEDFDEMGQGFAPHRGVAAHILWTYYAKIRGRAAI